MLTPPWRVKTLQNSLKGLTLQCTCEILLPNQSSHLSCIVFRERWNEKSPSHLQLSSLAVTPVCSGQRLRELLILHRGGSGYSKVLLLFCQRRQVVLECLYRCEDWLKRFPHFRQAYGFSPVWTLMCFLQSVRVRKVLQQILQAYFRAPSTTNTLCSDRAFLHLDRTSADARVSWGGREVGRLLLIS